MVNNLVYLVNFHNFAQVVAEIGRLRNLHLEPQVVNWRLALESG